MINQIKFSRRSLCHVYVESRDLSVGIHKQRNTG
jgi:hypothetical protein